MAVRKIRITGIDKKGILKLSDKGLTKAKRGDTIEWIIKTPKVDKITKIDRISSVDVFSPPPCKNSGKSLNWTGTINPNLPKGVNIETYCIYYTKKGSSVVYVDDPKIQVNS